MKTFTTLDWLKFGACSTRNLHIYIKSFLKNRAISITKKKNKQCKTIKFDRQTIILPKKKNILSYQIYIQISNDQKCCSLKQLYKPFKIFIEQTCLSSQGLSMGFNTNSLVHEDGWYLHTNSRVIIPQVIVLQLILCRVKLLKNYQFGRLLKAQIWKKLKFDLTFNMSLWVELVGRDF